MFVHEKSGLILNKEISRKIKISLIPRTGMDPILQKKEKAAFQSFTYFHACCSHYFKYNFYKFANTVFR